MSPKTTTHLIMTVSSYLGKDGLTVTSANHLANIAKEKLSKGFDKHLKELVKNGRTVCY